MQKRYKYLFFPGNAIVFTIMCFYVKCDCGKRRKMYYFHVLTIIFVYIPLLVIFEVLVACKLDGRIVCK